MNNNLPKQKSSLIGLAKITSSNSQQSLLSLDSHGIINQWFIDDSLFNLPIDNDINDIEDLSSTLKAKSVIHPHKAYRIHHIPFDMHFTSIKSFGDIVFITGECGTIGINSCKFINETHQETHHNNRIRIETINNDLTLKDNYHNQWIINGIEFNQQSGHLITYSNEGSIYMFDIQRQALINSNKNTNNSNNGYQMKHSISTAKLFDNDQIVYGGSDSKLTFLSSNEMKCIGAFDIYSNQYSLMDYSSSSQSYSHDLIPNQFKPCYDVTCLYLTPNYLLASCNNFLLKYSLSLNLCTNIIQTKYAINSFTKTDSHILVACDNKHLLKFPNDKLKPISIETSSSSLSSIELIQFPYSSNTLLITGGDSNMIDIINNELICSLVF